MIVAEANQRSKIATVQIPIGPADQSEEERWLDHYIGLWARMMRAKDDLPDGCPTEASGGAVGYNRFDFDEMLDSMDAQHAAETEHVINSQLSETERNVLLHAYGFIRWLGVRDYAETLRVAREKVKKGLMRSGLWFGQ